MTQIANHNIQGFILQTLQGPLNNSENTQFWLPGLLTKLKQGGKPALPFEVATLNVGTLDGSSATYISTTLAGSWASYLSATHSNIVAAIPNPDAPNPSMNLTDLVVNGLNNLSIVNSTTVPLADGQGYQSQIIAQFNSYLPPTLAGPLSVAANFQLDQAVCSSASTTSTVCDGTLCTTIVGKGTLSAQLGAKSNGALPPIPQPSDCFLSVTSVVTMSGTGSARKPSVEITNIDLLGSGQTGQPDVCFTTVTLTNVEPEVQARGFSDEVIFQLNTGSQGANAIYGMIKSQLNTPAHLSSFSSLLTNALEEALDGIFGVVGPAGLPSDSGQQISNPVDEYYFDRARAALNDPSGQYYVPTMVRNCTSPALEPFTTGTLSLGDITLPPPLQATTLSQVQLENLLISGLSNALLVANEMTLINGVLGAKLTLNALATPPAGTPMPPATATAQFMAVANGGIGQLGPSPTKLTVSSTAGVTTATTTVEASGDQLDNLVLNFTSLSIDALPADILIAINTGGSFNALINSAINTDQVKSQALVSINAYVAKDLDAISVQATKSLISMIKSKLGEG